EERGQLVPPRVPPRTAVGTASLPPPRVPHGRIAARAWPLLARAYLLALASALGGFALLAMGRQPFLRIVGAVAAMLGLALLSLLLWTFLATPRLELLRENRWLRRRRAELAHSRGIPPRR